MSLIGYARASTTDQDCSVQEAALRAAGCEVVRSERRSGTSLKGRGELETVLAFLREGDTLVVTRIDRLTRSLEDLLKVASILQSKGATLRALEQQIDTGSASGRAFFHMLGVFAQFETELRRERQMEGIAKAKAEGRYRGRPPTKPALAPEVRRRRAEGQSPTQIARELGMSRTTVYALLKEGVE
jgi:DNA invertase Pin-like site-specific DNA recombinase